MRLLNIAGAGLLALSLWCSLTAGQQADPNADNTKRNSDKSALTADDQKMNKTDQELARKIRQAIVKDKSLSMYAHNVKIIALSGSVTLRGPVKSDVEKQAIEAKAVQVAGAGNVKNEIEVKSDSADRSKQ